MQSDILLGSFPQEFLVQAAARIPDLPLASPPIVSGSGNPRRRLYDHFHLRCNYILLDCTKIRNPVLDAISLSPLLQYKFVIKLS